MHKANLERLLARRPEGIFINSFERGEIGPDRRAVAARCGVGQGSDLIRRLPFHDGN
jgi:hypothetical protein